MPRITPVSWKKLEAIFLRAGFKFKHQSGSHRTYIKPGIPRPVVLPMHNKPVATFIIQNNLKTAGISRDEYFKLLKDC
jgi:predicted RNA binding protein YcfA (HicA-like mRNA interferase family)